MHRMSVRGMLLAAGVVLGDAASALRPRPRPTTSSCASCPTARTRSRPATPSCNFSPRGRPPSASTSTAGTSPGRSRPGRTAAGWPAWRGSKVGENVVTARAPNGEGARLTLVNHPVGGPVFAGPQVQPWICTIEEPRDLQCNGATTFRFVYKSSVTGELPGLRPGRPAVRRRADHDRPGRDRAVRRPRRARHAGPLDLRDRRALRPGAAVGSRRAAARAGTASCTSRSAAAARRATARTPTAT